MSKNDIRKSKVLEHDGASLSCESTISSGGAVLGGELHRSTSKSLLNSSDVKGRRSYNDLNLARVESERLEYTSWEAATEVNASVALPVSSDEQFTQ